MTTERPEKNHLWLVRQPDKEGVSPHIEVLSAGQVAYAPPQKVLLPTTSGESPTASPALPLETKVEVCPTCKWTIQDDRHGWTRNPNKIGGILPCPMCSPRVKAIRATCKLNQETQELFGGANIPCYALTWDFASFPDSGDLIAKDEAKAFAARETLQRGLYLWGALGRGKTSLAISILKVFLEQGESGLYIRTSQFIRLVQRTARGIETQKGTVLLDLAYSVTCLVLDDLAVEQPTSAVIRELYELIEERRGTEGLYTVITSNFSLDDLEEHWRPESVVSGAFHEGLRVTDRLRESWGQLEVLSDSLRHRED